MENKIEYSKGYKYQLRSDAIFKTIIHPDKDIHAELVILKTDGTLAIKKYFAWDGCSGPTYDDHTNMRAGLCHDALYYLMRTRKLNIAYRFHADVMLKKLMIEDGALHFRAKYYEWTVNNFAEKCAMPEGSRKIIIAP